MALHLPTGFFKPRSVLEPVQIYEPSTYQPISQCFNHFAIKVGNIPTVHHYRFNSKFARIGQVRSSQSV